MKHTVQRLKLKNGLEGLVIKVRSANVLSLEINFRAGEFLLSRDKWETAHLMEHLMLGVNSQYKSSRQFQAELEKNGAYSNASTSVYDITYELECAAFESQRVMKLMVDALQAPVFKESEFKAEFGNVSEELEMRSNNHFRTLNIAIREALGLYGMGDMERVQKIHNVTTEDVKRHYDATHSNQNARFIICGNVQKSHLDILSKIELNSDCARMQMPDETPKSPGRAVIVKRSDVPNYYFYLDIYTKQLLSQAESDALAVASTVLTETYHSKILGTAREKGLVYAMGSGQQNIKNHSSFWMGAQVSKKNASKLFDLIVSVMKSAQKNGFSKAELDAAKQYMLGRHERSAQTVSGTLNQYSNNYYLDESIEDDAHFAERLNAVTNDQIKQVLAKVFGGQAWTLGLLGSINSAEAKVLYDKAEQLFL